MSTRLIKTIKRAVTAFHAGYGTKVSRAGFVATNRCDPYPKLQGSNIFDGFSKIDQGRSLLACTTRMLEIQQTRRTEVHPVGICPTCPGTKQGLRTHILAASTIHFSKNKTVSRRYVADNFRRLRRLLPVTGEANLIVTFVAVNGVLRNFSGLSRLALTVTFHCTDTRYRPGADANLRPIRSSCRYEQYANDDERFVPADCKSVAKSNVRRKNHSLPPFNHRGRFHAGGR